MVGGTASKLFFRYWPASGSDKLIIKIPEVGISWIVFLLFLVFFGLPLAIGLAIWKVFQAIWFIARFIAFLVMKLIGMFRKTEGHSNI